MQLSREGEECKVLLTYVGGNDLQYARATFIFLY
jgi:hypothetical protein